RADAEARMNAQAGDDERRKLATYVVDNGGDRAALERRIDEIWSDLERRHRGERRVGSYPPRTIGSMPPLALISPFMPAGDPPHAIDPLPPPGEPSDQYQHPLGIHG